MAVVLIIDDSPTELHLFQTMLEKAGFETLVADSGEEGLTAGRTWSASGRERGVTETESKTALESWLLENTPDTVFREPSGDACPERGDYASAKA